MALKNQLDVNPQLSGGSVNPLAGIDLGDDTIKFGESKKPEGEQKKPEGEQKLLDGEQKKPEGEQKLPDGEIKKSEPIVFSDEHRLAFINEKFNGGYGKIDDFVNEFTDLKTKATNFDNREKELQDLAKKANNPDDGFPELAKARSFLKATSVDGKSQYGLDTFLKVQSFDLDKVNHFDLLVDDFILRNPDVGKSEAVDYMENKYKLTLDSFDLDTEHEDYENHKQRAEQEILRNKLSIRDEAGPILEKFKDMQGKIAIPDYEADAKKAQDEAAAVQLQNKTRWDSLLPKMAESFKEFKAFKSGEKDPYITMEVSKEQQAKMEEMMGQYLENSGWGEATNDSIMDLGNIMYRMYSDMYQYEISNSLAIKKVAENDAMWAERTGIDPSKFKSEYIPPETIDKKSEADKKQTDNEKAILKYQY